MSIEHERLFSLIEFAKQTAKLKARPAGIISQHNGFSLYEHQVQGLPGIRLNERRDEDSDDIWLCVDRLHETTPPEITSSILSPWIELTQGPESEPRLKESTDGAAFIEAGTHHSSAKQFLTKDEKLLPGIHPRQSVSLNEYDKKAYVKTQFKNYVTDQWKPWADEEKMRRRTIKLYAQIFTLKQQLEGGIVEAQIELVWGVGLGIWSNNGNTLSYPLLTQLSEISLNSETAAIEIRPRMIEPRLEVDWYVSSDIAGVAEVEKASKEFFGKSNLALSPFDRGSFEPLLRAAVTHLDPAGVYWPDRTTAEDRLIPRQESFLKITDTWVIFARPRTSSIFIQDLENLKKAAGTKESPNELPEAVMAIVSNPTTSSAEVALPSFRGLSLTLGGSDPGTSSTGSVKPMDLFFPKPFNGEQVRIVQLLEASDGVVVQGPPGTGKTHTIANVICHFLANGKRILVTSMKDPALAVLHEKLPDEIKPLAIALLTSEQEGMQQFEGAIKRIAGEVQGLSQSEYRRSIHHLEESIDALHSKLAKVDTDISQWARKNLERINLDGEEIEPQDAAREVVEKADQFIWLPDKLNIDIRFQPKFTDTDILALREARRHLGKDLIYLNSVLPLVTEFPDSRMLLQVHQRLIPVYAIDPSS